MHVPWDDTLQQQVFPSKAMNDAIQWIDQIVASGNKVLINCAMGRSRSTTLVTAYLMVRQGYSYNNALSTIQSKRPIAQPNTAFAAQLRNIEASVKVRDAAAQPQQQQQQQQQLQPQQQQAAQYPQYAQHPYAQAYGGYPMGYPTTPYAGYQPVY